MKMTITIEQIPKARKASDFWISSVTYAPDGNKMVWLEHAEYGKVVMLELTAAESESLSKLFAKKAGEL